MSSPALNHRRHWITWVLAANALFSLCSGALMIGASAPLTKWMGLPRPQELVAIGISLALFSARLGWLAYSGRVHRAELFAISAMDLSWVLGTVALALFQPTLFSAAGVTLVFAVALVVLTFFVLQIYALGAGVPSSLQRA